MIVDMQEGIYHAIDIGQGKVVMLETGRLAKQADGAVVARLGDTMVLCTAVVEDEPRPGQSYFPLVVDYREKFSAGGKIPGGFIKREGRPNDKEILSSRLIDRFIRPLFPKGFRNETQVICYVLSADERYDADVVAGVGASAAVMLSGAPFDGPVGQVRVGRIDDDFVVNPTQEELEESDFDLIVAGKEDSIITVEGEMDEASEEEFAQALEFSQEAIRKLCVGQREFVQSAGGGKEPLEAELDTVPESLKAKVKDLVGEKMNELLSRPYKKEEFYGGIDALKDEAAEAFANAEQEEAEEVYSEEVAREAVDELQKAVMRRMVVEEGRRLDDRETTEIRDIWTEAGYLPRVHGSAIFTRGETQALASVTLGTSKDVQAVDQVFNTTDKKFFLHYNFPPFSTGEAKFLRGPSRRETGHGHLAERALEPLLPTGEDFPYTIRLISDILESNGSSSMASVCAGSLSLMDAGVPLKRPVAGIAMGLIQEGDQSAILTDILGMEDFLGDMDFKIAGTREGITACQMDIKMSGLDMDLVRKALEQAREGRFFILDKMSESLSDPRTELSKHAPRLTQIVIDDDFIGAVIGPGGKVIQQIQEETDTRIDIEEREGKGYVTIAATTGEGADAAIKWIEQIVAVPEVGEVYEGTVRSIQPFGAIVEILPGKDALLHISEIDHKYVEDIDEYFQVGDKIKVKLIEVRNDGKMRLTRKPFVSKEKENAQGD